MSDSRKRDRLNKLLQVRIVIVEAGIAETNEEAWLRHLATHPEDHYVNVRIINRQKPGAEPGTSTLKPPEKSAKVIKRATKQPGGNL